MSADVHLKHAGTWRTNIESTSSCQLMSTWNMQVLGELTLSPHHVSWCPPETSGYLGTWHVFTACSAVLFSLRDVLVNLGLIACYYARHKLKSNCISFKFSLDASHQQSFIFWSSIHVTIHFCHQVFVQDHLNWTVVHAHGVGYHWTPTLYYKIIEFSSR